MSLQPLSFTPSAGADELARAELYGLLARLYLAAPAPALLQQFSVAVTQAPEPGAALEAPWQALVAALRASSAQDAADEYDALFQGVGKPEVLLCASYYLAGFLNEKPLAALRHDLAALGLTRDAAMSETEDHIAYLFEVMRYLIAGDDAAVCNLQRQRQFFRAHLQPWVERLCDAVEQHPGARTYGLVAAFTRAFMQIEAQGFDMLA